MNLLRTSSKSITRVSQFASFTRRRPEYRLFSTEAPTPNLNADYYNSGDPQNQSRGPQPQGFNPPTRSSTQPPPHDYTATTQHNRRTSYSQIAPPLLPPAANFDPLPSGAFLARLTGVTKHTSKSDILNWLADPALTFEDIKHDYSLSFFAPLSVFVRYPSRQAYEVGHRTLVRKGRFKVEKAFDASKWHAINPFNGKYVLLHDIPRNATPADVSRFLSGCSHYTSSINIFTSTKRRMAIVGFPSQKLAMDALITKNRGLCLNQEINVQVLY